MGNETMKLVNLPTFIVDDAFYRFHEGEYSNPIDHIMGFGTMEIHRASTFMIF